MTPDDLARLSHAEKDALILALFERVAALEARLGRPPKTPGNSSVPPSRGQKGKRPPRDKKPRRKRDGPGVTRSLSADPDAVIDCHAECCGHCGTTLSADGQEQRHVYEHIELPAIQPIVTQIRLFGQRCPNCARRTRGAAPVDMPPGSPFGPSITALLAYLHSQHAVGYERLSRMMTELFGLSISEGAISNALRRASMAMDKAGAAIAAKLRQADVICCDETGARVTTDQDGTGMWWEWALVGPTAVLHRIEATRGRGVIEAVLQGHRPRCWVSDRWSAQQGHADQHQVCLAHVLRDVQYAIDCGEPRFAPELLRLLLWAIAIGRRRSTLKNATLRQYLGKADRKLDQILMTPTITGAGADLKRQTMRWRGQFFTFLTDRAVPPTNNEAERALRPSVIFRKVTNGFRSRWGAEAHALNRSVIGTGRLNGFTAHQAITRAINGQAILAD